MGTLGWNLIQFGGVALVAISSTLIGAWFRSGSFTVAVSGRAALLSAVLAVPPIAASEAGVALKVAIFGASAAAPASLGFGVVSALIFGHRGRKNGDTLSWRATKRVLSERLMEELEAIDTAGMDDLARHLHAVGTPANRVDQRIRAQVEASSRLPDTVRDLRLAELDVVKRNEDLAANEERINRYLRLARRWEMGSVIIGFRKDSRFPRPRRWRR